MVIKRIFLVVLAVIIASIPLTSVTNAAGKFDSMSISDQIKAYILYNSVDECFSGINDFRAADAAGTVWSSPGSGTNVNVGRYLDSGDEKWECKTIVSNLLPMLGYSSIGDMLQSWKYVLNSNGVWHHDDANLGPDRGKALRDNLFGGQTPALSAEHWYEIASTLFSKACSPKNGIKYADANASQKAAADAGGGTTKKVTVVTGTPPEVVEMIYEITPIRNATASGKGASKTAQNYGPSMGTYTSCTDLIDKMKANAAAYKAYVENHSTSGYEGGDLTGNAGGTAEGDVKSSCTIDGIGWVVCPVVRFLASMSDAAHNQLDKLMTVDAAKIFNTSGGEGSAYEYWKVMRNYANIAFILIFLIIIFSQITSVGISNYGIKKMLPKMIVVAILVNVSFFICAIAVDLSNMLGVSMTNFISDAVPSSGGPVANDGGFFGGLAATLLIGTIAYFALASFIGLIVFVVIASVTVLFILGLRQALIILLIVISPLAFVAYLMPNTEGLFKKWWGMFKSLLLIYPIIGLLYGAGKLASQILGGSDDTMIQIVAAFLLFAPLIMAYTLLKTSLSAFGALGQMTGSLQNRANSAAGGKAKDMYKNSDYAKYRTQQAAIKKAQIKGGDYKGWNPVTRGRSLVNRGLNKATGKYGSQRAARATSIEAKQHSEDVEEATSALSGKDDATILRMAQDTSLSDAQREAAAMHIMTKGSNDDKKALIQSAHTFKKQSTKDAVADAYAKSEMSSVYGKSVAASVRASNPSTGPVDLQQHLLDNAGNISASAVAGNAKFAKDVADAHQKASSPGASLDDQLAAGKIEALATSIDNDTSITPTVDAGIQLGRVRRAPSP